MGNSFIRSLFLISLFAFIPAALAGSGHEDNNHEEAAGDGCSIKASTDQIKAIVDQAVPSGANGRGPAAAIYRVDEKGDVRQTLFQENQNVPQAIASSQKILAAYTAFKSGHLNDQYTFTAGDDWYDCDDDHENCKNNPMNQGHPPLKDGDRIRVGDTVSVSDLIHGMLEQSSNGAAMAISHAVGGTTSNFMVMENKMAHDLLGDKDFNSYFQNPNGLTDTNSRYKFGADSSQRQHCTADNLARIMAKIMADPSFNSYISNSDLKTATKDGFLWKVGITRAAGNTLVVHIPMYGKCWGQSVVMTLFGDQGTYKNFSDATQSIQNLMMDKFQNSQDD